MEIEIESQNLEKMFSGLACMVVGDMALDKNHIGRFQGESREIEGLPIFQLDTITYNGGGAANLAINLAKLGVKTYVVGMWGSGNPLPNSSLDHIDVNRLLLQTIFDEAGVDYIGMVEDDSIITPTFGKYFLRVGHHIYRIDFGFEKPKPETENKLTENAINLSAICDFVVIADYSEELPGIITPQVIQDIKSLSIPKFATSRQRIKEFSGFDYLVINQKELFESSNVGSKEADKIRYLFLSAQTKNILVTKGSTGSTIYINKEHSYQTFSVPSKAVKEQIDPCGAGDTFLAVYVAAISSGIDIKQSIQLATAAARSTIKKLFTTGYPTYEEIWGEYNQIFSSDS